MTPQIALLISEDGHVFRGYSWGATGCAMGKAVLNTSLSGYQAELTDPANAQSIIVMTSPHVGNVGVHAADALSDSYHARGLVVREPSRLASNWQSEGELEPALARAGVVGIHRVDTRAISQLIIAHPTLRFGIFSGASLPEAVADLNPTTPLPRSVIDTLIADVVSSGQETA
ncbi:MAG: carbamoyl-phosphate synthase domain-containing protein [Actinomycetaceae bacterium]|nr:carbamoyl-phosphate synthase domain-containing protein [Actinomycetaceae bacterium]